MDWHRCYVTNTDIVTKTSTSYLIKFSKNSTYSGFQFWVSAKLIKEGSYFIFNDTFKFNIFKNGKGEHNKYEKIEERIITADDMRTKWQSAENEEYTIINEAPKLENKEVYVLKQLLK